MKVPEVTLENERGEQLPLSELSLVESIYRGTKLTATSHQQPPNFADKSSIRLTIADQEDEHERKLNLWVWGRSRVVQNGVKHWRMYALDPLTIADGVREFVAHQGSRPLNKLADALLSRKTQLSPPPDQSRDNAATIEIPWILQCHESDTEFIRRLSQMYGCTPWWDGEQTVFGRVGHGLQPSKESVDLSESEHVINFSQYVSQSADPIQVSWVDSESFEQRITHNSQSTNSQGAMRYFRGVNGANGRMADSSQGRRHLRFGAELSVKSTQCDLKLGSRVSLRGQDYLIDRIRHHWSINNSYHNVFHAVAATRFGADQKNHRSSIVGPFHAEIVDNDDPEHRGRVRLRLLDDPRRLPTNWLPVVQPAASPNSGWQWLPELHETVLIIASSAAPEQMYVMGSIRGGLNHVQGKWQKRKNGVKGIATADGMQVTFDDDTHQIELQTPGSSFTLGSDGTVTLRGKRLDINFSEDAEIVATNRIKVDGHRIDLGE